MQVTGCSQKNCIGGILFSLITAPAKHFKQISYFSQPFLVYPRCRESVPLYHDVRSSYSCVPLTFTSLWQGGTLAHLKVARSISHRMLHGTTGCCMLHMMMHVTRDVACPTGCCMSHRTLQLTPAVKADWNMLGNFKISSLSMLSK